MYARSTMTRQELWDSLENLGLTQKTSADVLGVTLRQMQRYYSGQAAIPEILARVLRMMVRLEIDPKELRA